MFWSKGSFCHHVSMLEAFIIAAWGALSSSRIVIIAEPMDFFDVRNIRDGQVPCASQYLLTLPSTPRSEHRDDVGVFYEESGRGTATSGVTFFIHIEFPGSPMISPPPQSKRPAVNFHPFNGSLATCQHLDPLVHPFAGVAQVDNVESV